MVDIEQLKNLSKSKIFVRERERKGGGGGKGRKKKRYDFHVSSEKGSGWKPCKNFYIAGRKLHDDGWDEEEETRWKLKAPREDNSSRFAFPLTRSSLTILFASSNSPRILELENELANSRIRYFVALRTWLEAFPSLRGKGGEEKKEPSPSPSILLSLSLDLPCLSFIPLTASRICGQRKNSLEKREKKKRRKRKRKKGRKKEKGGTLISGLKLLLLASRIKRASRFI